VLALPALRLSLNHLLHCPWLRVRVEEVVEEELVVELERVTADWSQRLVAFAGDLKTTLER
jgi:hypothetical protein